MREPLVLQLEKFSYYQHLSLSGGKERPIYTCRTVDIRGAQFHVLSRIADAGLDFTGRTNFIAHHLVFTPEEVRHYPIPPVILRDWLGWVKAWAKEPEMLENESWSGLTVLNGQANVPAQAWARSTGEAANGYGLLEARSGSSFRVDAVPDEIVLELLAESLELLDLRDARRDFRAVAWNYTFTTSMQEQDNPADFRWRCIHADNPGAARFAGPDCRDLMAVRPMKTPTAEEASFAREGRQAPRFVSHPQSFVLKEGEVARFTAKAEGVPSPAYQWYSVDRNNQATLLSGETKPELVVANPPLGISRYLVAAANPMGTGQSEVATLQVQQKPRVQQPSPSALRVRVDDSEPAPRKKTPHIRTEEEIEANRAQIRLDQEEADKVARGVWTRILMAVLILMLVLTGLLAAWFFRPQPPKFVSPLEVLTKGNVVAIGVTVRGSQPLVYEWFKGDQMIDSGSNALLTLSGWNLTNGGSFLVTVTNKSGAVTSQSLSWPGLPPVILQMGTLKNADGSVGLEPTVSGGSPLTYQWYRDNVGPIALATNAVLRVTDTGSYRVIIKNAAGTVTSDPIIGLSGATMLKTFPFKTNSATTNKPSQSVNH